VNLIAAALALFGVYRFAMVIAAAPNVPEKDRPEVTEFSRVLGMMVDSVRGPLLAMPYERPLSGMALIPSGAFISGNQGHPVYTEIRVIGARLAWEAEWKVTDAYYIDVHEVTIGEYAKFLNAVAIAEVQKKQKSLQSKSYKPAFWDHPGRVPKEWEMATSRTEHLPVVGVDWYDAAAFCAWAGKRLPTDDEWQKASRGVNGRYWPWGNRLPSKGWYNGPGSEDDFPFTALIGSFDRDRSFFDVADLAGTVEEWVEGKRQDRKPILGFSWKKAGRRRTDIEDSAGTWYTEERPDNRLEDAGFRCAADGPGAQTPLPATEEILRSTLRLVGELLGWAKR